MRCHYALFRLINNAAVCDLGFTGPERVDVGRAEAVLCGKYMDQTTHCK